MKWAPNAADRFYHLLTSNFYVGTVFNRVLPGFVAEFGLSGKPERGQKWQKIIGKADPKVKSNINATIAFATSSVGCVRPPPKGHACPPLPRPRGTEVFVNMGDNQFLDDQGYVPFGRVTLGYAFLETLKRVDPTQAQQAK